MAWLTDWAKRIELDIDYTNKIGASVTQFPVTIFLKSGNGDTTKVFDEVGANSKKIAVTESDGTTELKVEIEQWDNTNKVGVLHTSLSSWTISSNTSIYLYYDNTHADNSNVGNIGETAGKAVWDSNFKGVWHLKDDDTSHVKDSSSNGNNGTKKGAGEPAETDGKIGKGQSFDGTDDYIGGLGNFGQPNTLTISLWFKTTEASWDIIFGQTDAVPPDTVSAHVPVFVIKNTGVLRAELWTGSKGEISTSSSVGDGNWHHAVIVGNVNTQSLYVDGDLVDSRSGTIDQSWWQYSFFGTGFGGTDRSFPSNAWHYFNGLIDEARVSNTNRSAAWIKGTYNTLNDSLLTYGSESLAAKYLAGVISGLASIAGNLPVTKKLAGLINGLASLTSSLSYSFPQVAAVTGGYDTSGTSHTVNLPSGIVAGNLLLVFFCAGEGSSPTITFPDGWTELFQTPNYINCTIGGWYRVADGTEESTITVTTSSSEYSAHTSYRITGYAGVPECGNSTGGQSTKPNPPSLTPSWGAMDTLWFAVTGVENNYDVSSYPTNYTDGRLDGVVIRVATCRRELNASSEDPGVFTFSDSVYWVANTVAIGPGRTLTHNLAGLISGIASVAGDLTKGVIEYLAGVVEGAASVVGTLTKQGIKELAGLISGVASISGVLAGLPRNLAGTIAGTATVIGNLTTRYLQYLAGVITGVASVAGNLPITKKIAGAVSGIASVSGITKVLHTLAGTIAGLASISGLASITKKLTGIVSGVASVLGDLTTGCFQYLKGLVEGVASIAGNLPVTKKLAGLINGLASLAGSLSSYVTRISKLKLSGKLDRVYILKSKLEKVYQLKGRLK